MSTTTTKPRILTGDTPTSTGLHLGHYVGSLENRLKLQADYDCYFLIANVHAFTTLAEKPTEIRANTLGIIKDWLAVGLDPDRSTFVLQSEIPAIAELTFLFAMLIPFNKVMRNPTLKTEIDSKGLGDTYPFGFPMYAVGQCADILAFRPDLVPVGEDQEAHIEMCRDVALKFNQLYCGVGNRVLPEDHHKQGRGLPDPAREDRPRGQARWPRWQEQDEQEPEQRDLPVRQREGRAEEGEQDRDGTDDRDEPHRV